MKNTKDILYIVAALLLGSCADDASLTATKEAGKRIPLHIEATLGAGSGVTRAANNYFEEGDQLLAYIRHIKSDNNVISNVDVPGSQAPKLVTFVKGSTVMKDDDHTDITLSTTDLTTSPILYWDDFSDSRNPEHDLRTTGTDLWHGLQSYYGYCYNGGTPTTALSPTDGKLGWTVKTSQHTDNNFKNSDLLWSFTQTPVSYAHAASQDANHNTLTIPYTHAMSQISVTLTADKGFNVSDSPLKDVVLTLSNMNTVAAVDAVAQKVTSTTPATITMQGDTKTTAMIRDFAAIVAPGTHLTLDGLLLTIADADGNNYTLNFTSTIQSGWSDQLTAQTGYYETKPGVNYHLDVKVDKARIDVVATLQPWTEVTATGTPDIQLPVGVEVTGGTFASNSRFSLFRLAHSEASDAANKRTNDSYDFATVPTYSTQWTNTPLIYWVNSSTAYYFRALARNKGVATEGDPVLIDSVGVFSSDPSVTPHAVSTILTQGTMADGCDVLWGTTPANSDLALTTDEGAAQRPRKESYVPITFRHAMSAVTFILQTSSDAAAAVDLTNATVSIDTIYTKGNILIDDGSITPEEPKAVHAITGIAHTDFKKYSVIPQTVTDDAKVIITLADGTTYSLKLNTCKSVTGGSGTATDPYTYGSPIDKWERGTHYTYTVYLEKEQITFRALVQEWDEKTGSGDATMEWD